MGTRGGEDWEVAFEPPFFFFLGFLFFFLAAAGRQLEFCNVHGGRLYLRMLHH